ncbi:hypothetical protein [Brevundimonas sp.]|uniref:hypothetical protein n=1 Tax=Brevundimonas sp. TaxID=1871086 RepID=UPI002D48B3CB|nr:hypothetical protein [Brevundimonas sp.]HYD26966.1 hypothetical protein [Brevundimonas sp.]
MADAWPLSSFPIGFYRPRIVGTVFDGGPTIFRPGQLARVDGGGWWEMELDGSKITTQAQRQEWNALMLDAEQGVGLFEVPYLQETPEIHTARSQGAVALGATTVAIQRLSGGGGWSIGRGMVFEVDHPTVGKRAYMVKRQISNVGSVDTCEVRPTVREAFADDTPLNFINPHILMRIDDREGDAWPRFDGTWGAETSVRFVEAFGV